MTNQPKERRLWTCPSCGQKYKIPAMKKTPEACPECTPSSQSPVKKTVTGEIADDSNCDVNENGPKEQASENPFTSGQVTSGKEKRSEWVATIVAWIVAGIVGLYILGWTLAVPYYNWQFANKHGFWKWVFLGELVATAQAFAWPYDMAFGGEESALTSEERAEERAFVEQWNQWLDDHPEEINDLRTRGIAGDLTQEEMAREMIGLLVRFSYEADLDIPQRIIDEFKKEALLDKE